MTQTSLKTPFKDLPPFKDPTPFKDPAPFQGAMKRSYRERLEDAPIKKRVMAEIHLKRRGLDALPRPPKVKQEQGEEPYPDSDLDMEGRAELQVVGGMAKALDLSPGLKHTLAQFTLSSQSSLGGPAAFSARTGREPSPADLPPPTSPPVLGGGPLLVPCDSSTELSHSLLEGESISCFLVGGEKRLCLPQVLNSVLRDFSLQQINAVCDELYVYCSRCDGEQLHILKVLGILPFNAPSCGLITLTDAQRLCNALLRPGAALPADPGGKQTAGAGLLEEGGAGGGFQVEHRCLGKGQGLFVARFYGGPDAPCIQCLECRLLFSPQKFVMHSHRSPDKRTCHWGFDSAKWPRYLQLARKYQGGPREAELQQRLAELKEKFHCQTKRTPDREEESQLRKPSLDDKLADGDAPRKGGSSPASLVLNRLFPDIKEEPGRPPLVQPSYFLYTYDKTVAPNVSLRRDAEVSPEVLGLLLRHQSLPNNQSQQTETEQEEPPMDLHASPHRERRIPAVSKEMSSPSRRKAAHAPACHPPPPPSSLLSAGTEAAEDLSAEGAGLEDDKDRIVVEIMQMYSRQQEKLNSTLQKQLQLEMELEAVRGGEAARLLELSVEQKELRSELEAVHSEQVRQLSHARLEQLQLETRLETLRQQACACQPGTPRQQEAIYTAQLAELSQRLERAEAERQELQAELRAERAAREKLERTIAQLKQQMGGSSSPSASPSPSPTTASTDTNSPPCPAPEAGPTALE